MRIPIRMVFLCSVNAIDFLNRFSFVKYHMNGILYDSSKSFPFVSLFSASRGSTKSFYQLNLTYGTYLDQTLH